MSAEDGDLRWLSEDGVQSSDVPLLVLFVISILFCCVWGPTVCRNLLLYCGYQREPFGSRHDRGQVIRVSLPNLNLLTLDPSIQNAFSGSAHMRGMSREDRQGFIENVLVSRKIIKICDTGPDDSSNKDLEAQETVDAKETASNETIKKSDALQNEDENDVPVKSLVLADIMNHEETITMDNVEPCPICLTEYAEGDILCWSQNSHCQHMFHRQCATEWLLQHEECPLCRHNYLSLDGDEENHVGHQLPPVAPIAAEDDAYAYLRGVHLFHLISRLQSLADARPNTTIRLEGVELANGQRGNMEIQQATASNSILDAAGRGLNVRVTTREEEEEEEMQNRSRRRLRLDRNWTSSRQAPVAPTASSSPDQMNGTDTQTEHSMPNASNLDSAETTGATTSDISEPSMERRVQSTVEEWHGSNRDLSSLPENGQNVTRAHRDADSV